MSSVRHNQLAYQGILQKRRRTRAKNLPQWFPDAADSRPPDRIRYTPRASVKGLRRGRPSRWDTVPPQFNPTYLYELIEPKRRRNFRTRHGTIILGPGAQLAPPSDFLHTPKRRIYRLRHGILIAIPYSVVAATPPPYPPQYIRYRRTPGLRARRGFVYFWWPQATQPIADIHVVEPISGVLVTDGRTSGILVTDGQTTGILFTDGRTTTVIVS